MAAEEAQQAKRSSEAPPSVNRYFTSAGQQAFIYRGLRDIDAQHAAPGLAVTPVFAVVKAAGPVSARPARKDKPKMELG